LPGNCSQGQLTVEGYNNHFALGKYFRQRYVTELGFLGVNYNSTAMYLRSTDVDRTIQSAQAQMLAFYPQEFRGNSQVIDIFTLQSSVETLAPNNLCPTLVSMCNVAQNSSAWANEYQMYIPLQQKLEAMWNTTVLPWEIGLFDSLYARKKNGIPWPAGMTEDIFDQITGLAVWQLQNLYGDQTRVQLGIGKFISELLQQMNANINGQAQPKWILYSAHDTSVAFVLSALQLLNNITTWPPFAAHIEIELYQDSTQNYFVQVLYMSQPIVLPGCLTTMCPFSTFEKILSQVAISQQQWLQQCGLSHDFHSRYMRMSAPLLREMRLKDSNNFGTSTITLYFC